MSQSCILPTHRQVPATGAKSSTSPWPPITGTECDCWHTKQSLPIRVQALQEAAEIHRNNGRNSANCDLFQQAPAVAVIGLANPV